MEKKKKVPGFVPVLWVITTCMWTVTFTVNLHRGYTEEGLLILQGMTVVASLAAAVANYIRWRRGKEEEE